MKAWLTAALVLLPVYGWSNPFSFYDWQRTEYTVSAGLGTGTVSHSDGDSDRTLIPSVGLGLQFPFRRHWKWTVDADFQGVGIDAQSDDVGLTVRRYGLTASVAYRQTLTRRLAVWGGAGTGLVYGSYTDRHTVTENGFLDEELPDESGFETAFRVFGQAEWYLARRLSLLITPRYDHTFDDGMNVLTLTTGLRIGW